MDNNRRGQQNFNQSMGRFNNLMGNFANLMGDLGSQTSQGLQNVGEQLGEWGQQMGNWGQSMPDIFGDGNFSSGGQNRQNQFTTTNYANNYYNRGQQPTNVPNFGFFNNAEAGYQNQGDGRNYFSNQNRNQMYTNNNHQNNNTMPHRAQRQHNNHRHNNRHNGNPHNNFQPTHRGQYRHNKKVKTEDMMPEKILLKEAKSYIQKEEYDHAIDSLLKAIDIKPEPQFNQLLAFCYLKKRDFNLAIALLTDGVSKDPNNSKIHRYLGICYMEKAKQSTSIELINKGVENFHTAYDITGSELNYRNYLNAKKLRFLALEEKALMKKHKLIESIRKYDAGNIEPLLKKTYLEKQTKLPEHFRCAITLDLMREPYQTPSGISYEKEALKAFIEKAEAKDPITSEPFGSFEDCVPNYALKESIRLLMKKNPAIFEFYETSNDWRDIEFNE